MKALYVLRLSFICAYGDIEHKTKQHNEHSHLFFVCVLWDDCKRWYNHMWHNASFIASNTLRKERERASSYTETCMLCVLIDKNLWQSVSTFDFSLSITFCTQNADFILQSKQKKSWRDFHFAKLNKIYKISFVYLNNDPELFSFCFLKQFPFLFKIRDDKLMIIIIGAI